MAKPAPATGAELKQACVKFVETQQKDAKRIVKYILVTTDAR